MSVNDARLPELVSFLACDLILQDAQTSAKTLVNVMHQLNATAAPFPVRLGCYAKLVDGEGEYNFLLRLVDLSNDVAIVQFPIPTQRWQSGSDVFELVVNLQGVVIPHFGAFEFQLHAGGAYLGRHIIKVREMKLPQVPPTGPR